MSHKSLGQILGVSKVFIFDSSLVNCRVRHEFDFFKKKFSPVP